MFILEPNDVSKKLARKRVTVCEYPDGRLEVQHEGHVLPYRQFDKMRQVNQPAIVENRHLDAALMLARQMQAIMPPHRKRNNDARSEEHTSELQSLMRISYDVFCLKKNNTTTHKIHSITQIEKPQ